MATRTVEPLVTQDTESGSLSAYGPARSMIMAEPLDSEALRKTHAYWRACNYLSLGMIYLQGNPLLREPLKPEHIKNRLLGHWGTSPGLSLDIAIGYLPLTRRMTRFRARVLNNPRVGSCPGARNSRPGQQHAPRRREVPARAGLREAVSP